MTMRRRWLRRISRARRRDRGFVLDPQHDASSKEQYRLAVRDPRLSSERRRVDRRPLARRSTSPTSPSRSAVTCRDRSRTQQPCETARLAPRALRRSRCVAVLVSMARTRFTACSASRPTAAIVRGRSRVQTLLPGLQPRRSQLRSIAQRLAPQLRSICPAQRRGPLRIRVVRTSVPHPTARAIPGPTVRWPSSVALTRAIAVIVARSVRARPVPPLAVEPGWVLTRRQSTRRTRTLRFQLVAVRASHGSFWARCPGGEVAPPVVHLRRGRAFAYPLGSVPRTIT